MHFYSGWDVMRTSHEEATCGCWCEAAFSPENELLELHVLICEVHMDMASKAIALQIRCEDDQLTIP